MVALMLARQSATPLQIGLGKTLRQARADLIKCSAATSGKDWLYYIIQEFSLRPVVEIYVPGGRLADVRISDQAPR